MKISLVCHGNIARSQVLHHYLAEYARKSDLEIELFSCGTAPANAYPNANILLDEVQNELRRRGLNGRVKRNTLDAEALQHLINSDLILVADNNRRQEVLSQLGEQEHSKKTMLFYEYIGEGERDFTDTYDAKIGAQDPERFSSCFDELARIARLAIVKIKKNN